MDWEHAIVLRRVKALLGDIGVAGIWGIGPVFIDEDGTADCIVRMNVGGVDLSDPVFVYTGRRTLVVTLRCETHSRLNAANLFVGGPAPRIFPGRLRGGDYCQNTAWCGYGTISFFSSVRIDGRQFDHACVSCAHVLQHPQNTDVEAGPFGVCMTVEWASPLPDAGKWTDVAVAKPYNRIADELVVRGLGKIQGMRQPAAGDIVLKYGATTGLTAGLDFGLVWRAIDHTAPTTLYLVRTVWGNFSAVGDSGAAVLDQSRNLLGLVVGGIPGLRGEQWYLPVLPEGEAPPDSELSALRLGFV